MPRINSKPTYLVNDIEHAKSIFNSPTINLYFLELKQKRLKMQLKNIDKQRKIIIKHLDKVTERIRENAY
ncbi:MAG: hypothetical protein AB1796_05105 [Bacillota bacterium]